MTKTKLEYIPDPEMYIFFKKWIRSATYFISNRYSKANKKHLKSYDAKQESKHIIDANSLYGYAMYNFLSISRFKCIDPKKTSLE